MLSPKEIAYAVTKALDEKKGMNIKLLKIDKVSSLADYFLICTGTSNTHVRTLCDFAEYTLEELGEPMLGREGHRGNSWELLDYGTIVVHVFTEEAREFYSLERLWADAETVDISDVILISRVAAEDKAVSLTTAGKFNSDVDGNTKITSADATKILRFIAKLIKEEELAP